MDLLLSDEQEELRSSFARGIAKELPLERLHGAKGQAADDTSLQIFADLGWLRVSMREEWGGLGMSYAEEVLLFRELGRNLGSLSLLSGVLGARVAAGAGQIDLAESILNGEEVGLIVPERSQSPGPDGAGDARLFGAADCRMAVVILPETASLVDVSMLDDDRSPCLDDLLSMRKFALSRARCVAETQDPGIWWQGSLMTAAMAVGLAEGARDMILEYAKVRQTFGRPIGAYQAVRHPIAEMTARAEHARCQTYYAALALGMGRADASMQVSAARAVAQGAARKNADANIQLHGAVGITNELSAHLLLKRSLVLANLFGSRKVALHHVLNGELMEV